MNAIIFARNKDFMIQIINKLSPLFDYILILGLDEDKFNSSPYVNKEKLILINDYVNPENIDYNLDYYSSFEDYDEFLNYSKMVQDSYIRDGLMYSDSTIIDDNNFRYYLFWNRLLIDYEIDFVIRLGSVPHFAFELSLFYLAEYRKKKIIFSWHSGIYPVIYFGSTLKHNSNNNYYELNPDLDVKKILVKELQNKLNIALREDHHNLTPYYMKVNLRLLLITDKIHRIISISRRLLKTSHRKRILINQLARMTNQKGSSYLREVKKKSLNTLPAKYVYLPLHLQPEASTNPLGSLYNRLPVIFAEVLNLIPEDYLIVVKENPKQTAHSRLHRYIDLFKNKRFQIVSSSFDTYELIKNSSLVISITGTAIFEASIMGKNSVLLGNNIYHLLPNVFRLDKNLKANISSILNNSKKSMKIDDFNNYINEMSKSGAISPLLSETSNAFTMEEINNISKRLEEIIFLHRE